MTTVGLDKEEILFSLLERGWNIFPIEPNGKRPVVTSTGVGEDGQPFESRLKWNTLQYNKVSKDQVRKWHAQWPDSNWAVVCGRISGIVVVDVDGEEGVQSLERHHPEMAGIRTFIQKTPKGHHLFFKHPGDGVDVKSFPILHKVDVKADGGYVVISPSKIDGLPYTIFQEVDLAACPGWVVRGEGVREDESSSEQVGGVQKPQWVSELIASGSPSGRRNEDAARLVGYFWGHGVSKDIIEAIIAPWAERCQPPFSMRELKTVIRSISSYQQMAKNHGVIDPPILTSSGTGYKYSWHNLGIDMLVSKLMDSERYGIIGELEVHTSGIISLPKYLYGPIDVSFKDSRAIATLVSELEKRMFGPPWKQMVGDMARLTVGQFTQGQPWVVLRDAPRALQSGYAHKPLLLAKEPTLWFSAGGGLKSYLALTLAVQMETGLDLGLGPSLVRNHVAYLDWEWDVGQHARRLDTLIPPSEQERLGVNIVYRNCGGRPLRKQLDELKRLIAKEGVTYVIIDSASPACGRASDNDEIVAFFQGISQLGVGSLILAHITKSDRNSGQDSVSTAFGGIQWENQARSTWHLKKVQDEGSSVASVLMSHHKINAGNVSPTLAVQFEFPYEDDADGTVRINMIDPNGVDDDGMSDNLRERIRFVVKNRPLTLEQIAEAVNVPASEGLYSAIKGMERTSLARLVRTINGEQVELWGARVGRTDY
jgi:hypothetical protein